MERQQIIDMIFALKAKKNQAKEMMQAHRFAASVKHTQRRIKNIDSVIDRLSFNYNNLPASRERLQDTIAEAELFLLD